jgi:uncharacterized protein (DUF736 family)
VVGRYTLTASPTFSPTAERKHDMAQIGSFIRTRNGFSGRLRTLSLDIELAIVPADHADAENAPNYRIHAGNEEGPEVGAGWTRTGEKAGEYVALQIDDPAFTQPIRANLFQSGSDRSAFHLLWTRLTKREART